MDFFRGEAVPITCIHSTSPNMGLILNEFDDGHELICNINYHNNGNTYQIVFFILCSLKGMLLIDVENKPKSDHLINFLQNKRIAVRGWNFPSRASDAVTAYCGFNPFMGKDCVFDIVKHLDKNSYNSSIRGILTIFIEKMPDYDYLFPKPNPDRSSNRSVDSILVDAFQAYVCRLALTKIRNVKPFNPPRIESNHRPQMEFPPHNAKVLPFYSDVDPSDFFKTGFLYNQKLWIELFPDIVTSIQIIKDTDPQLMKIVHSYEDGSLMSIGIQWKSESYHPIALLQFCSSRGVLIIQCTRQSLELRHFVSSHPFVTKDLNKFVRKRYARFLSPQPCHLSNFVDIHDKLDESSYSTEFTNMAGVFVGQCYGNFKRKLGKKAHDWENDQLTFQQLIYVALDVAAVYMTYPVLEHAPRNQANVIEYDDDMPDPVSFQFTDLTPVINQQPLNQPPPPQPQKRQTGHRVFDQYFADN